MSSHIVSAIMSFAARYSQEPWFEGVFWGGSSLYKPVDQNTDIDVFVVANDYLPARIHGTTICNGLTIASCVALHCDCYYGTLDTGIGILESPTQICQHKILICITRKETHAFKRKNRIVICL